MGEIIQGMIKMQQNATNEQNGQSERESSTLALFIVSLKISKCTLLIVSIVGPLPKYVYHLLKIVKVVKLRSKTLGENITTLNIIIIIMQCCVHDARVRTYFKFLISDY